MSRRPIRIAVRFLCLLWACDSGGFNAHADQIPTKLAFIVEPAAPIQGRPMSVVAVTVQDVYGNTVANASTVVTVTIGINAAGATLTGTTKVSTVRGAAVFLNLVLDDCGTGYTLIANAPGLAPATSGRFDVGCINPVAWMNDFIPSCAPVGGSDFTLTVRGFNFVSGSVVRWNGNDRPTRLTTFEGQSALVAQIAASDIAAAGMASVTIFNPAPGGGTSGALNFTVTAGGANPASIAIDPTGTFAYVANVGCWDAFPGNVSMFRIDATTGTLTSIGPPVTADFGPVSVTVDPSGKFVHVANSGDHDVNSGSVSTYTIDAITGALTSNGAIVPNGPGSSRGNTPRSVAVHPSGKFAYVALEGGFDPNSVAEFAIDATTGALTFIGENFSAGRVVAVAIHPSGKFAYVTNDHYSGVATDTVSMCTVDGSTGALSCTGAVAAGSEPAWITIDPSGKFAYVANQLSNDVSMYTIDGNTGTLTSIGRIAAGTGPSTFAPSVAVEPAGKFAYMANSGGALGAVSMYAIDASGALTSIGTIPAGFLPSSIIVHPSGKFAYVTDINSNDVSMYSIDATTGALTLIGTTGT